MPTYPTGPRLLKGAIVAIRDDSPQPRTITLQYNPESVKRSLSLQHPGETERCAAGVRHVGDSAAGRSADPVRVGTKPCAACSPEHTLHQRGIVRYDTEPD